MAGSLLARRPGVAALVAALAATAAMAGARFGAGAPMPAEMLFNAAARLLGVPAVFNAVHLLPWGLDRYAKFVLFGASIVAFVAMWTLLGLAYRPLARRLGAAGAVLAYGLAMAALVGLVLFPLQGLGLLGLAPANFSQPPLAAHLWAFGFGLLFGLVLASLAGRGRRPPAEAPGERREALRRMRGVLVALAAGGTLARLAAGAWARAQAAEGFLARIVGLSPEITPTRDHYVVSKNVFDPGVEEAEWRLHLGGLVERELVLTLDDLKALPSVERSTTLICVSNPVGGDLIGNSVWTGVRLADLLELAGVREGASEVVLRAADDYVDTFPIDAALRDGTIVAYLQNGEPLTRAHGFPARVLVPGIYGMKNVKWVVAIDLAGEDRLGYWQERGWSDEAIVHTMSRIDTGRATRLPDGTVAIGGVAFAGLRGVSRVEVSTDDGATWQEATLSPAANPYSWNLWGLRWDAAPGTYTVRVRATDGGGELQTAERSRPLPDGATGYHALRVRVPDA